jgi:hypothetical protein
MSLKGKALRFVAEKLANGVLSSAGQQIGEAIGKRIGAKIYTPPPDEKADKDGKP